MTVLDTITNTCFRKLFTALCALFPAFYFDVTKMYELSLLRTGHERNARGLQSLVADCFYLSGANEPLMMYFSFWKEKKRKKREKNPHKKKSKKSTSPCTLIIPHRAIQLTTEGTLI